MICGCGFPNSRHNFEPAAAQFGLLFPHASTVLTVPESPMFHAPEAGGQYAETDTIAATLCEEIASPMIPEETCAAIANGDKPNGDA